MDYVDNEKCLGEIDLMIIRLEQLILDLEKVKELYNKKNSYGQYQFKERATVKRGFVDINSRSKDFIDTLYGKEKDLEVK